MEPIGRRILALRQERGWTQTELADAAHVTQSVVSRLERGSFTRPTFEVLASLAKALGVGIEQLTGGAGASAPAPSPAPSPTFVPDAVDPVELALFDVMREKPYTPRVFDAARQAIRDSARWMAPGTDPRDIARGLLEAAASLDRDGYPLTSTAILARLVTGKSPHATEAAAEASKSLNAEIDARLAERGVTPEDIARNKAKLKAQIQKNRRIRGEG